MYRIEPANLLNTPTRNVIQNELVHLTFTTVKFVFLTDEELEQNCGWKGNVYGM